METPHTSSRGPEPSRSTIWPLDEELKDRPPSCRSMTFWRTPTSRSPLLRDRRQLNQMGRDAMKHAREFCPERFAQLSDQDGYFFDLGEQMSERIGQLEEQMAGNALEGEAWIDKIGRLNMARARAREAVYSELYQEWPPEASTEDEDPDEPWFNLHSPLTPEEGGPEPQD